VAVGVAHCWLKANQSKKCLIFFAMRFTGRDDIKSMRTKAKPKLKVWGNGENVEMWKVEKLSDCHGSRKNAGGNNDCLCVSCQFSSIYLAGVLENVYLSMQAAFLLHFFWGRGGGTYRKKQLMI